MAMRSEFKRRRSQRLRDVASFGRRTPRFDFLRIREEIRLQQFEVKLDNVPQLGTRAVKTNADKL